MNYEIFVVSLEGEDARRNHVKSQFAQYDLEPEFVNAIDMRNTQPELLSNYHEVMRSKRYVNCVLPRWGALFHILK